MENAQVRSTVATVLPWQGSTYQAARFHDKKIMILGESSYGVANGPDYEPGMECHYLMEDAIGYDEGNGYWNKSRFYTRIARIFGCDPQDYVQRDQFWNSVAFYNYLLGLQPAARSVPPAQLWTDSYASFNEALRLTQPDILFGFSMRMWPHISKEATPGQQIECHDFFPSAHLQRSDGGRTLLVGLRHPCGAGFVWKTYVNPVQEILQNA